MIGEHRRRQSDIQQQTRISVNRILKMCFLSLILVTLSKYTCEGKMPMPIASRFADFKIHYNIITTAISYLNYTSKTNISFRLFRV